MKTCEKCQEPKSFDQFRRNHLSRDGYCHVCKPCMEQPQIASSVVYEFDYKALAGQLPFLRLYARRSLNRKPPAIIVSVPYAKCTELNRFCDFIGMDRRAIIDLPREDRKQDRLGVILYHVTMSGDLLFFKGCLQWEADHAHSHENVAG
jgi:hypothetical protein